MSSQSRKQHWIDAQVQGTLVRRVLIHWCIFFVGTLVSWYVLQLLLGDPSTPIVDRMTASGSNILLLLVIMLSIFPAFALDTVRFSNRFVGPIARLRGAMRKLSNGSLSSKLAFRDNDFWSEVAEEFNALSERVQNQEREIEDLLQKVADLESTSSP